MKRILVCGEAFLGVLVSGAIGGSIVDRTIALGSIAELLSGIGTIVGLTFIYQQLKLSRAAQEGLTTQLRLGAEQTFLQRKALEASISPLLSTAAQIEGHEEVHFENGPSIGLSHLGAVLVPASTADHAFCSISLVNTGAGVALLRGLGIQTTSDHGWVGKASKSVVAPGEFVRFTFSVPKDRPELNDIIEGLEIGSVTVEVGYTDASGELTRRTRAMLSNSGGTWRIRQIFLYNDWVPDSEPFATSAPADI